MHVSVFEKENPRPWWGRGRIEPLVANTFYDVYGNRGDDERNHGKRADRSYPPAEVAYGAHQPLGDGIGEMMYGKLGKYASCGDSYEDCREP